MRVAKLPDGSLMLLDGHLRAETLPDAEIPVLVLDVTEAEGDKILATLDPLAAMAEADAAKLDELLREVQTGNDSVATVLSSLAEEHGIVPPDFEPATADDQSRLDEKAKVCCPECGHEFTP